jgi:septal ring factor EnvC (AmiA/AmiB activator)
LNLELLNLEQRKLQAKVTEKQDEKDSIDQDLINFTRQKYQLIEEKQIIQENLNSLKVEHHQIQAQIIAQKKEKEAIEEALSHFDEQRRQLLEKLHNLKVQILPSPLPLPPTQVTELPDEWAEFREQILDREFLILKAIAEQDNPSTAIKKIAEENLTMPEVLIDSINERAMDTIGDLIIEPGLSSTPSIREEYLMVVKKIIQT